MAKVIFEHASRHHPGNPVPSVDKLDLEIEDGEFLVMVGPSGCGKSTSLRMLAGLENVNEGQILIGDENVTHAERTRPGGRQPARSRQVSRPQAQGPFGRPTPTRSHGPGHRSQTPGVPVG